MSGKFKLISRFEKNPFVENAVNEINSHIVRKYQSASSTERKATLQAVDNDGQLIGHTSFVRKIKVDNEKFAKVYLDQLACFHDLNKVGIKIFTYILTLLIKDQDYFYISINKCLEATGYKSKKSIYQGLTELINSDIIARTDDDFRYFINPLVIFNGNRITYATEYVKVVEPDNKKQLNAFEDGE